MDQDEKDTFTSALDDLSTLWLTIYGEFRGEPIEAQIAGGNVIINRYEKNHKSIKDVCLAPLQFSCWNLNDPNLDKLRTAYFGTDNIDKAIIAQIRYIAAGLMRNAFLDNTHGATHYLTMALLMSNHAPAWSHNMEHKAVIGNTVFLA